MIKVLNDDFLKILNLKDLNSFDFFNKKYIINYNIENLTDHLTNGLGSSDDVNRYIFKLIKDNKDYFYSRLEKEIKEPFSYLYRDKDTLDKLKYALSGQGIMYFFSSCDKDTIKTFLNLFFLYWDNVLEIYNYTNEKLEDEANFLNKKEYDSIFISEFLDNLENVAILK